MVFRKTWKLYKNYFFQYRWTQTDQLWAKKQLLLICRWNKMLMNSSTQIVIGKSTDASCELFWMMNLVVKAVMGRGTMARLSSILETCLSSDHHRERQFCTVFSRCSFAEPGIPHFTSFPLPPQICFKLGFKCGCPDWSTTRGKIMLISYYNGL